MPRSPLEIVLAMFPEHWRDGKTDLKELVGEEGFWPRLEDGLDPGARIRFITPEGGGMGSLGGHFTGPEGFRAGWLEWLRPFDSFVLSLEDARRNEEGTRVLLLVTTHATLAGSNAAIDQPSATVFELDGERIVAIDHYLDHGQATKAFEETNNGT